jgi:uncharacterized membrane protein
MKDKNKKSLYITLFVVDILLTVFLFVLSIVMLATMPSDQTELENATGMIGWFQNNPTYILVLVVIPLFIAFSSQCSGLDSVRKTLWTSQESRTSRSL